MAQRLTPEQALTGLFSIQCSLHTLIDSIEEEDPGRAFLLSLLTHDLEKCASVLDNAFPGPQSDNGKGAE